MKYSKFVGLILASSVAAGEIEKRAKQYFDTDILNYALTLEQLEQAFYKEALAKFTQADFEKAGYVTRTRFNLREVHSDESEHVKFLTKAIKAVNVEPVKPCKYDFGLKDIDTFIGLASLLEGVGVSAYLGAAQFIGEKNYLTDAASILTVEARHNAYIRDNMLPPQSPFPAPFDVPLGLNQVYTLASAFIKSCPKDNPVLPVGAFPSLTVAGSARPLQKVGGSVIMDVGKTKTGAAVIDERKKQPLYAAFILVTGPVWTKVKPMKGGKKVMIKIPKGVSGQSYVVLTNNNYGVYDQNTIAGPGIVQVKAPYTMGGFPM